MSGMLSDVNMLACGCSLTIKIIYVVDGVSGLTKSCSCSVTQLSLILCNPMDCNLPGSFIHGISRQQYWSGLPFPSPGDLPNLGIEPASPALAGGVFTTEPPKEALTKSLRYKKMNDLFQVIQIRGAKIKQYAKPGLLNHRVSLSPTRIHSLLIEITTCTTAPLRVSSQTRVES